MKKTFIIILSLIILMFFIPVIFTTRRIEKVFSKVEEKEIKEMEILEYDYSKYKNIKLLHEDTQKIEEVNLDEYIACVVSAEMPVDYNIEALKAQAIVARTYTIYKITTSKKHQEADVCDKSSCCQAWISKEDRLEKWDKDKSISNWNKILEAVNGTLGKIITYGGKPINAFFHANSGGKTQIPFYVWGGTGYPYLQVIETLGEEAYSGYSSEVKITKKELVEKLKKEHKNLKIDFKEKDCIKIKERDDSNRVVIVKIGNLNLSGVETRTLLGLRSANFTVEIKEENIIFKVIGYGHGVGMSQSGADALANQGKKYEEIIKHFYTGVEITEIN